MKKLIRPIAVGLLLNGIFMNAFAAWPAQKFYVGLGGSFNTIDESFDSFLLSSSRRSGKDHYDASRNRLAPMAQFGYFAPICCGEWMWGGKAEWKYLIYKTPNEDSSRGQHIPNATFSSINFFGREVLRDFSSQTRLNNEILFLLYFGKKLCNGYAYLGIGPALFTASNSIYLTSVHTPNGIGDNLISTSETKHETVWGGAVQIGYNYYIDPSWFLDFSYTYAESERHNFNNSVNAAIFNGAEIPGPTTLHLNRSIRFGVQEVVFSINKFFEI